MIEIKIHQLKILSRDRCEITILLAEQFPRELVLDKQTVHLQLDYSTLKQMLEGMDNFDITPDESVH